MNETTTNITTTNSVKPNGLLSNTINCRQDTSTYWLIAAFITIIIGIIINCIRYRRRYFQSEEEYKSYYVKRITDIVEQQLVTKVSIFTDFPFPTHILKECGAMFITMPMQR